MVFIYKGDCWLFIKSYDGAHATRRGVSTFQSDVIPNWPRLKDTDTVAERYDCIEVTFFV